MNGARQKELRLYSHSDLLYWWPVWLTAFIMAFVTWQQGSPVTMGGIDVLVHPNKSLGVLFFVILSVVILVTNVPMRGLVSAVVLLVVVVVVILLAYLNLWDDVLNLFGGFAIFFNLAFYVSFGIVLCVMWLTVVFLFDRLSYYRVKPGQLTEAHLLGTGARNWNTTNMRFEKKRDDPFRHWILGLGTGDLHLTTMNNEHIVIHNVFFLGHKISRLEQLIAAQPDRV